jgi:hypothetical protein
MLKSLIEQIKNDRVTQVLLAGVVLMIPVACVVAVLVAYAVLGDQQASPSDQQEAPAIALPKSVVQAYLNLAILQIVTLTLENTAEQIQAGEVNGIEGTSFLLGLGTLLQVVDENVQQAPPVEGLSPAWDKARIASPIIKSIVSRWLDNEISSADVPGALSEAKPHIDQMWRMSMAFPPMNCSVFVRKPAKSLTKASNSNRELGSLHLDKILCGRLAYPDTFNFIIVDPLACQINNCLVNSGTLFSDQSCL